MAVVLTAAVGLLAATAGTASASTRGPCLRVIRGTFVDPGLVLTNPQPTNDAGTAYTFDVTGGTTLSGDVSGTTTYTGHVDVDLTANTIALTLTENFTGTVAGIGTGHLTLLDRGSGAINGAGQINSLVVGGSGDLARVRGAMHWAWAAINADGSTSGTYAGLLIG